MNSMSLCKMDFEWRGYGLPPMRGRQVMKRGAPVLQWADKSLVENKLLVQYLVWANPANFQFATCMLRADPDIIFAALASPFYDQKDPPCAENRVLACVSEVMRSDKKVVLTAVARSGYELEFASTSLRADPYVVAWAGAPVGAAKFRDLSPVFMRLLLSDVSVEHLDKNWKALSEDQDMLSFSHLILPWPTLPVSEFSARKRNKAGGDKNSVRAQLKAMLDARCPLFLRIAPPMRDVLWPQQQKI